MIVYNDPFVPLVFRTFPRLVSASVTISRSLLVSARISVLWIKEIYWLCPRLVICFTVVGSMSWVWLVVSFLLLSVLWAGVGRCLSVHRDPICYSQPRQWSPQNPALAPLSDPDRCSSCSLWYKLMFLYSIVVIMLSFSERLLGGLTKLNEKCSVVCVQCCELAR